MRRRKSSTFHRIIHRVCPIKLTNGYHTARVTVRAPKHKRIIHAATLLKEPATVWTFPLTGTALHTKMDHAQHPAGSG